MPYQVEVKGIDRTNIEPGDVVAVHTKDVGLMTEGNIDDFIDDYYQPPMSRYFATIDVNKVEGIPNLKNQSFAQTTNIEYGKNLTNIMESDYQYLKYYIQNTTGKSISNFSDFKNWLDTYQHKINVSFKYFNYFFALKDQISAYFALMTHKLIIDWCVRVKV